jgi:hypothetical protein
VEDRNGLANLTTAAAASVVESHFLGVGGREGIALGDRQGGREDVRFASSLRGAFGGLLLIPLFGRRMFFLGDTPFPFLLFLLFFLRHVIFFFPATLDFLSGGDSVTSDAGKTKVDSVAIMSSI